MATRPLVTRSLMDEFLPHCDFGASYEVRINAPASVVYESLLRSDFSDIWLVRLLMSIRSGKRLPRNRMPGDLRQRLQGTGFVVLAEAPNEEIVIGVAGRFWRPQSTVLSTETRIKCFGQAALWKFRSYWSLVGPFSGLMRKAILKQVKTEAEAKTA